MLEGVNFNGLHDFGEQQRSPASGDQCGYGAIYSSDEFRMYAYKIRRCPRTRSHDWTECPYAHRGEKATRRDPRRYGYCAVACPAFRNGACHRGDACEYAHGVFEYWLHPARYRTRVCHAGQACARKVCFFAHTTEQLRSAQARRRCSYSYRLCRNGGGRGGPEGGERSTWLPRRTLKSDEGNKDTNEGCMEGPEEWYDVLEKSWSRLKIRDENEASDLDLSHIDWISKLVD